MRADRLLSILLLLQVHRRMTAGELARRLEVSERTIHRDMAALGMAGVPVTAERGTGGGWHLLDGYRTNLTGLNEAEIQALFLTRPPRILADLGLDRAAEAGLIKLLAALPAMARQGAQDARQRIYVDVAGWRSSHEPIPHLATLQEAIWSEQRVRFTYHRTDGVTVERLAEPLGLVAKGSIWYIIAVVEGELRTYRVSRVQSATLTGECFTRPPDFDLATYWESSASQFTATLPRYDARLRVAPEVLPLLRSGSHYTRILSEGAPESDGWVPIEISFEEAHGARECILGYGAQIQVVEPAELRDEVVHAAEATVALYRALAVTSS